jgi:hypothetical protein
LYTACLFCNRSLGRNESIEHFQVGSRLAYDQAKGRLWVVCEFCKRWNLTPLEERWEAIEEAEREFRASPLRVSTDNIGLAQLRSGLELIRVGKPPRVELAAWRYGDDFNKRRRRHLTLVTVSAAAAIGAPAFYMFPVRTIGTGVGAAVSVVACADPIIRMAKDWGNKTLQRLLVRDNEGRLLPLTTVNMRCAALIPTGPYVGWELTLPFRKLRPANRFLRSFGVRNTTLPAEETAVLSGDTAQRALASMLPHLNRDGGSEKRVREAVDVIAESRNLEHLLRQASLNTEAKKTHLKIKDGESNVSALPGRFRLALEMALHEEHETRAMEGELRELEDRWRDAEAIAAIADSLLTAPDVEAAFVAIQARSLPAEGST